MAHLQLLVQHEFPAEDGSTLFNVAPGDISLGVGAPDEVVLVAARAVYEAAAAEALRRPTANSLFQYGPTMGDGGFLTQLARFLTRQYGGGDVLRERLVVTSGASFGLTVLCHLFMRPGRCVFVPDPCYFVARDIFRDAGLTIVPVRSDDDGMCMDELAAALAEHGVQPNAAAEPGHQDVFSALIYLVPTFCNPTSATLPLARRHELIACARKHGCLIACDDVYDLIRFPGRPSPPPRLVALDTEGHGCVISNGSFSKIFGPGLRLGWIETREWIINVIAQSGIYYSGGSPNHLTSGIMRVALETRRLDDLLEFTRATYAERCAVLTAGLRAHLPRGAISMHDPDGGFFVWARLPKGVDAETLLELARTKYHVIFQPGNWSTIRKQYPNHIRVGFTYNDAAALAVAAERLAAAIREVAGI